MGLEIRCYALRLQVSPPKRAALDKPQEPQEPQEPQPEVQEILEAPMRTVVPLKQIESHNLFGKPL